MRNAAAPIPAKRRAAPARAELAVYEFAFTPTRGPLAGQQQAGRFVYDTSIIPAGGSGTVSAGPGGTPLRSFGYDLGATRFTAGNVDARLQFTNGALTRFRIGETSPGVISDGTDYFFMDSLFGYAEFKIAGNNQLYGGGMTTATVCAGTSTCCSIST